MVSLDHPIDMFPVTDFESNLDSDYVPDIVYTYLNDVFGQEMLQTYSPRGKQTPKKYVKK